MSKIREQVQEALKEGYTPDEIWQHFSQDSEIKEALSLYDANEVKEFIGLKGAKTIGKTNYLIESSIIIATIFGIAVIVYMSNWFNLLFSKKNRKNKKENLTQNNWLRWVTFFQKFQLPSFMNKIQKRILITYCIIIFLLGIIFVPWKVRFNDEEFFIGVNRYAPIWTKSRDLIKMKQDKDFICYVEESIIALDRLMVEFLVTTLIAIAIYVITDKK